MLQFSIKSVELTNFKTHKHLLIEPSMAGLTALLGANGAGKSSVVDGIAWCLFGSKPNSSFKNASWRTYGSDFAADTTSVTLVLAVVDGSVITVTRSIKGKNSVVECECMVDDVLQAGPAVSHAQKWIIHSLGMGEKEFLNTIFVQQKQVGTLVNCSRSERRNVLEQLTGITTVTDALTMAKDSEKTLTTMAKTINVDPEKISTLEDNIKNSNLMLEKALKGLGTLNNSLQDVNNKGMKASKEYSEIVENHKILSDYNLQLKECSTRRTILEDSINNLIARKNSLSESLPSKHLSSDEISKIRGELDTNTGKLDELNKQLAEYYSQQAANTKNSEIIAENENTISTLKSKLEELDTNTVRSEYDSLTKNISVLESKNGEFSTVLDGLKQIQNSKDGKKEFKCPTCGQTISDINHAIREYEENISANNKMLGEYSNKLHECEQTINSISECEQTISLKTAENVRLKGTITDNNVIDKQIAETGGMIKAVKANIIAYQNTINEYESFKMMYEQYNQVLAEIQNAISSNDSNEKQITDITSKINSMPTISDKTVENKRKMLESLREQREQLKVRIAESNGDIKLLQNSIENDTNSLAELKNQAERKKDFLKKVEIASESSTILTRFRQHMIMTSIPNITQYASELVQTISGGKISSIELTDQFDIHVTIDNNNTLDIGQLSGGENDLVAICLRLAISVTLAAGKPTLLILDEILTAMDAQRAEKVLEALQKMVSGQTIIIAHNSVVKGFADHVIEL